MFKTDVLEAKPIVDVTLDALLTWTPTRGRPGADLRTAVGDVKAHALGLLREDAIAMPLIRCFDLAYMNGINVFQMETVRRIAAAQPAVSVGAIMTKDALIQLAFATSGYIISNMIFTSREDVERLKSGINTAFEDTEEQLADRMDSMTWRAVLKLHAAMTLHLVETARPLPRMLNYRFHLTMPSVVMAHRLYADAGRADELRSENKIVHPAFCPREGRALSA
jgi:prophage DNA circulation protein